LATYIGISLLGGLIWRRANRWGALASLLAACGTNFSLHAWAGTRLDAFDPAVFGYALLAGIVALVVFSLLTPREGARTQALFDRLDTPVDRENEPVETARAGAAASGQQLLLPNLLRLRAAACGEPFFRAYREDLRGLGLAWLVVVGMIGGAWLLLGM
jgi:hypothetical protein